MKHFPILAGLAMALLLHPGQAGAQTWSPQQQEVWTAVLAQWHAATEMDPYSMHRFLHPDQRGWSPGDPVPLDAGSSAWAHFEESAFTVVRDLVPIEIVF
ncbi:MAG: hypothetical protein H0U67_07115 [Gemmatimonadetes bacterium]|nr:hypothetical protein [Gemmatimonadota bacterium]